jgi:hypothetical protein
MPCSRFAVRSAALTIYTLHNAPLAERRLQIYGYCKIFCDISYSRIDNARLNFTLDTPGSTSELKNF